MIENDRSAKASLLAEQVKLWLDTSRRPETFQRGEWPHWFTQAQKDRYRQELDQAYEKAKSWLARLEPYSTALQGVSDLRTLVLERKDALLREIQKRQTDRLSSAEQKFFGKDVEDLERLAHGRFGKKFPVIKRPASRVPEHLKDNRDS